MAKITCPEGCEGLLPEVKFDECNPEVNGSEIRAIYVGKKNIEPFTDWTQLSEWTQRLSQDGSDNNAIRKLVVTADKPAPTVNEINISNGRRIVKSKSHVLNVDIDETNDTNYEFMRKLECSGQAKFWYETEAGKLYGGNEGIDGSISLSDVLGRGENAIELLQGQVTWNDKFHPERTDSPMA